MNKQDFYKEIMSRYTFDQEEILKNAKRASSLSFLSRSSKWLPLSTAAAALFITIFGGYMLLNLNFGDGGLADPAGSVSISDRTRALEEMWLILNDEDYNIEKRNIYISFENPMTYRELESALSLASSDTGSIEIIALWNSGFINAANAASDPNALFEGAKVSAYATFELILALSERIEFSAVELDDVVTDSNFEPISTTGPIDFTPPPVSDPANNNEARTGDNPSVSNPSGENPAGDDNPAIGDTPPVSDPANNDEPTADDPITDTPAEPETIFDIITENALSVDFIGDTRFILLTKNNIYLYEINVVDDYHEIQVITSFEASNPAITFTDPSSGTRLIITSDAAGRQNGLFIADGINGELKRLSTSGIASGLDINYALYNSGDIVLKAQNESLHAIYLAKADNDLAFELIEESPDRLIILNFTENEFIYAHVTEEGTKFYSYDTAQVESTELDLGISDTGELVFERSRNGRSFAVVTADGAFVWNPEINALTENTADTDVVRFHRFSGDVFSNGAGKWYQVTGAEIIPITENEANTLARRVIFSSLYKVHEISSGMVSIEIR